MRTRRATFISIGASITLAAGAAATALAPGASAGASQPVDSVVTTTDDYPFEGPDGVCDDGPGKTCSLREAVVEANVNGGMVTFGVDGTFPLRGDIGVDGTHSVVIQGNGVDKTVIENEEVQFNFRGGGIEDRHFRVDDGTSLSISDMTLQGGSNEGGGSILVIGSGSLRTEDVHFLDNAADMGGAIYANADDRTITIIDTTFAGNRAIEGGAIHVDNDTASIQNSTFTDNTAEAGAAIYSTSNSTVDIHWSTFSQNTAANPFRKLFRPSQEQQPMGGTIYNEDFADVTVSHSILEKLSGDSTDECVGRPSTSGGANIVDDMSCEFTEPLDDEGTAANVGPLQDNGGATFTMALAADSAAVDVDTELCKLNDQRDLPRNNDGDGDGTDACDSGAYELQPEPEESTTTSTEPDGDADANTATPATPTVARPTFTG